MKIQLHLVCCPLSDNSYFLNASATLFHFILVQFLALISIFCGIAAAALLLDMWGVKNKAGILDPPEDN